MAKGDGEEEEDVEDRPGKSSEARKLESEGVQVRASISEQQVLRLRCASASLRMTNQWRFGDASLRMTIL